MYVAVYDLTPADEKDLDEWEGERPRAVPQGARAGRPARRARTLAWVYVLDAYEGGLPSAHYLGVLADAAEAAGAPDDYVTAVRSMPCRSVGNGSRRE